MFQVAYILPSLILFAGLVDDLRSQKVHNWLVLSAMAVAVVGTFFLGGVDGLKDGLMGGGLAIAFMLPMVLIGMVGAGDMKLMMAFGLSTNATIVLWVIVYSFIWGALLGLVRALLQKEGWNLLKNSFALITGKPRQELKLHKIPFTVALFFGWLTQVSLEASGGLL